MNAQVCDREDELLEALGRGYVGAELESHLTSCAACSELRLVAGALLDDHAHAVAEAPVPSSSMMMARIRIRMRQDAQATARRSLLIGQAATLLIAIALVAAFFGTDVAGSVKSLASTIKFSTPLLLGFTAWIVAAPIAGWVAIRQK